MHENNQSAAESTGGGVEAGLPITSQLSDLSEPHDKLRFCTRANLYDRVTSMYLDCWDDAEIAGALSAESGCDVSPETISGVRVEASVEAEARQSPEIRRKWIYRYRHLTVNNLVKEYMFLEGKNDFLRAKRELADEIDFLVRTSPADRLLIAVNDALGRNNIGMDLIEKVLAYGRAARKVEAAIGAYEKSKGMTFRGGVVEVARMVSAIHGRASAQGGKGTAAFMATLLGCSEKTFGEEDVEFCLECAKFSLVTNTWAANPLSRIMQGADMNTGQSALLDQVLAGIAHDLSAPEVMQLVTQVRQAPLLSEGQRDKLRMYAERHISDIEMKDKLAVSETSFRQRQQELKAVQELIRVLEEHFSLRDAATFFTPQDIANAARRGIIEPHLQAMLAKLNLLRTMDAVVEQITKQELNTKFDFPAQRYIQRRFGVSGPF